MLGTRMIKISVLGTARSSQLERRSATRRLVEAQGKSSVREGVFSARNFWTSKLASANVDLSRQSH